jgi:hypothetical protein
MTSRLTIVLATAGLLAAHLASTARANITFQITDLGGGNTQWQLLESDTTYTVGPLDQTGGYGEQIILPQNAFAFDYSQPFTLAFSSPIGVIEDLTTGQSVPLDHIYFFTQLDELMLYGGVMNHPLGDRFQITDFSASDIAIPFSDLTGPTGSTQNLYSTPGAWHNDAAIDIIPVHIPEPSSLAFFVFVVAGLLLRLYSRGRLDSSFYGSP